MTTVKELISELEKMPKDMVVLLNNNTSDNSVSVFFSKINVEQQEMSFPTGESNVKEKIILLNQGGII
ncbi:MULTISPECIES: hypothetical protein [unclassified Maribacter]|uniref:hypothetical protein n=1 Tax=unclassified Maribacter TaxID=2615042 RepID=UPI00257B1053|nr:MULTISPECIES: hypothetical protein [unclassified Maribacter]|tara:strand:- start:67 stop:270 length:204 start_codon:yes stop_codon:yes gene_type:complete